MKKRENYIGIEISKTSNMLRRKFMYPVNSEVEQLKGKNGWIIGYLAENEGKEIFQRDIEEHFSLRRSTVSSMLQLMEKKGLIIRESVDYDARLKRLSLTEKAREMLDRMNIYIEQHEKLLRKDITSEELEVFFSVLKKIRDNAENRR